jgi:hypothetical protein
MFWILKRCSVLFCLDVILYLCRNVNWADIYISNEKSLGIIMGLNVRTTNEPNLYTLYYNKVPDPTIIA